jgi:SAM-dependent methyltransferase
MSEPPDQERAGSDSARTARQYDVMAAAYAGDNEESAFNAFYERPAVISLLGDVKRRRVLEVGCGSGPLLRWLVDHGADVTAVDISPAMVALARSRIGSRARLLVADVAAPLDFAGDRSFDLIVASLVLHYIRDWEPVFKEFRRVLEPCGRVVFSTHHPTMDARIHSPDDYFAIKQVTERWRKGQRSYDVTFWRRPLTAMTEAVVSAGFSIANLVEPAPLPELADRDPDAYELLRTRPRFLFFELSSPAS